MKKTKKQQFEKWCFNKPETSKKERKATRKTVCGRWDILNQRMVYTSLCVGTMLPKKALDILTQGIRIIVNKAAKGKLTKPDAIRREAEKLCARLIQNNTIIEQRGVISNSNETVEVDVSNICREIRSYENGIIEEAFEKFEKKHGHPHSCDTRYMRKP